MSEKQDCAGMLLLDKNERTVSWVLNRLKKDAGRKQANTLAIFQSVPIYCAALAVRQSKEVSAKDRNWNAVETYRTFAAEAFLEWLQKEYDFHAPSWVTMELMGMATFQDYEKKLYDPRKETLWKTYQRISRDIRKTVTPWLNKRLAAFGHQEVLPSGQQLDILMQELTSFLWGATQAGAPKRMSRSDYEKKLLEGEKLEIVSDFLEAGSSDRPDDDFRAVGGGSEGGDGAGRKGEVMDGDTGGNGAGQNDGGSQPPEADAEAMVNVRMTVPDTWVHRDSLVVCLFSKISESPDEDLNLTLSSATHNKKRKFPGDNGTIENVGVSSPPPFGNYKLLGEAMDLLGKGNESHRRSDAKKKKEEEVKETKPKKEKVKARGRRLEELTLRVMKRLEKPPQDEEIKQATAAVEDIARAVAKSIELQELLAKRSNEDQVQDAQLTLHGARVNARNQEIKWQREKIELLEKVGAPDQVKRAELELVSLYDKPLDDFVTGDRSRRQSNGGSGGGSAGGQGNVCSGCGDTGDGSSGYRKGGRRIMADPPPAAGGANVSQIVGQAMEETRTQLSQLSFKISKCEIALESHGSYLGITDSAILLDQLKALQRKDKQFREMLLILMRASPLHAPQPTPPPLANATTLLPAPPPPQALPPSPETLAIAPTPPAATPASGDAPNVHRSCTLLETNARRKRARVAAANDSTVASASAAPLSTPLPRPPPPQTPAAARTPSPPRSSLSPSHLTPHPKTTPEVPPGKTLSLYEALGLTPPPKASALAVAPETGQSARRRITNNGSGDTSLSSTPPAYFPGRHSLYRANIPRGGALGDAGGSANGGNSPGGVRGEVSTSSPAAGLPRCGHGAEAGASNRHAECGRSPATALASSTTGGRSSDKGRRAPESEAPANPPKNKDSASGGGASSAGGIGSTLAGTGAGQGELAMATEMATAALAGPAEEMATLRELADVAMAFTMRSNKVSPPARAEGQEGVAISGAKIPSTNHIHRDGNKRMAAKGRGTTAIASLGATASSTGSPPSKTVAQSEAVATAAGNMVKKELVEADGNGGDEAVVANPVRSGSATSTRGTRERQRRTPTRPLRVSPRLIRSSVLAIVKSAAPTVSTNPSPTCSPDAQAGTPAMQQGVEAAKPPTRSTAASTPPGDAPPSGKSEGAFGGDVAAEKPPVAGVPAEPDADASRRGNGDDMYGGRPPRKRRKSEQISGRRSRYNAEEFELGESSSSSRSSSSSTSDHDTKSDGDVKQPRDGGVGGVGSMDTGSIEEGDAEWDETLVDVGGYKDSDEDGFWDDGGDGGKGVGGGRGMRLVRKRDSPKAWKRRCVDETCLVGASFGIEGKPAAHCSSHKDAGMVNVTHRRCEEPGGSFGRCNHRPRFNMEGERAMYCLAHKRNGMINVSSPRCNSPGCRVRPSFGFDGDARATYCDGHKKPSMVNVRKRKHRTSREIRRPSSTSENERSEDGSKPCTEDAASAASADLPSSIAQDSPLPFPSRSKPTTAEIAAAAPAPTVPGSGTDNAGVERVDFGSGASGMSAGGPREEEAVSPVPGVSSS